MERWLCTSRISSELEVYRKHAISLNDGERLEWARGAGDIMCRRARTGLPGLKVEPHDPASPSLVGRYEAADLRQRPFAGERRLNGFQSNYPETARLNQPVAGAGAAGARP
ncbi:MAG: hypothetical protein ACM3VX_08125 [Bacteroidota bacterium]